MKHSTKFRSHLRQSTHILRHHVHHHSYLASDFISVGNPCRLFSKPVTDYSILNTRPVLPKPFSANQPKTIRLYPLSNYTFGTKENQPEEDPSVLARLKRLEEHYEQHGMRRTCEGILVCHEHNHPHILMLQIANAFFKLCVFAASIERSSCLS